jgi:AcrR family transcriptional regulator
VSRPGAYGAVRYLPWCLYSVKIGRVNTAKGTGRSAYHHGSLREALVHAAVELAREGGPAAIVLREAARRVGVTPNAAYHHFESLPDLIREVAKEARHGLALSMDAELGKYVATGEPGTDAMNRLSVVGRGYVRFALAEPGLFATAFPIPQAGKDAPDPSAEQGAGRRGPFTILGEALAAISDADLLAESPDSAALNAWSAVHGLSLLLLGPLATRTVEEREAAIDSGLDFIVRGLTRSPAGSDRAFAHGAS